MTRALIDYGWLWDYERFPNLVDRIPEIIDLISHPLKNFPGYSARA